MTGIRTRIERLEAALGNQRDTDQRAEKRAEQIRRARIRAGIDPDRPSTPFPPGVTGLAEMLKFARERAGIR